MPPAVPFLIGIGTAVTAGSVGGGGAAIIGGLTVASTLASATMGIVQAATVPKVPGLPSGLSTKLFQARRRAIDRQRSAFGASRSRLVGQNAPSPALATQPILGTTPRPGAKAQL